MSEVQYPFIDVAVHDRVSEAFAAGMAVVLFAPDLRTACWANGRGATLFGFSSVYDFLDQGPDRAELMFRQVEPIARSLKAVGDRRSFTIRIASGFSRVAVQARCEMIRFQGKSCVLLAVPADNQRLSLSERAARLIEGLDDPETGMAVLDGEGTVLAASGQFSALDISIQTTRMLVSMAGNDRHRLVKRPISTVNGYLPAAIGKIADEPALHLLFVVGIAQAKAASVPPVDEVAHPAEDVAATEELEPAGYEDEYQEALSAVAAIEDNPETEEEISLGEELDGSGAEGAQEPAEDSPPIIEDEAPEAEDHSAEPNMDRAAPQDETESETGNRDGQEDAHALGTRDDALPDAGEPTAIPAAPDAGIAQAVQPTDGAEEPVPAGKTAAAPGLRTVRFVWKIDAGGRFSEVSREFADAVGPHAADISGMAFSDLAALFNLDPDGKIAELLSKRDTWSGKTIWWPVEGTSLAVPVDLAALPTYTRTREFDGFRGFGIVRMADAAEDPHAAGLSLGAAHPEGDMLPATEQAAPMAQQREADAADLEQDVSRPELSAVDTLHSDETTPAAPGVDGGDASDALEDDMPEGDERGDDTPEGNEPEGDLFDAISDVPEPPALSEPSAGERLPSGERPALKLVGNPGKRKSDKIIQLEEHRSRLSPGEQANFQEIARRLDTFAKETEDADASGSEVDDIEAVGHDAGSSTTVSDTISIAPENDPHALLAQERGDGIELPSPAGEDESRPDEDEQLENTTTEIADESVSEATELPPAADSPPSETIPTETETAEPPQPADAQAAVHLLPGRDRIGLSADIVDQMPVALLIHAGDRLIHANGEFLKLTAYSSLEALADVGGLDALLQRQELEDKTSEAGGMVVVRADDVIVPVTARLQSIRWNDAAALMLALMPVAPPAADEIEGETAEVITTGPIRAADQLARLQVEVEELRAILETATDGVVIIGADGEVRSMNRAASALFNFDAEEINGKPFVTLFAHESQRAIVDYLGGLSGHGVASVLNDGREVIGREASGGFLPLFMTIGRLTSSNGYCAVIRDITQWKRTEEELRTAKRAAETANAHKSEFLAHVSHEIRTPLNAIIGFADMMASERLGPVGHPRYVEYSNDIGRSGRHVLDIVNDLLDISKIEAGEMDLDFVAVGLNETVSEAVSLVQPQANSQRVIIRTALSQAVPQVVADLRSVKQIVLNILSNAIRFTPSGGQIVVSTAYETNGSVVLRIRDTGIGMTRAELELAMKPFRQVAGASRKRGDGTGLGLPLTKAMVDANRAAFNITSAPNEGTLVEVTFPSQRVLAS
jgi:PAS domain S-box-containing protein